jgi:photosystem II stability/assembly factor-like uncharacterized protein
LVYHWSNGSIQLVGQLLRQLNNTQPGFMFLNPGVGNNLPAEDNVYLWIPSSDLTTPVLKPYTSGLVFPAGAFGKGRFILLTYTYNRFMYHIWDGSNVNNAEPRYGWGTDDAGPMDNDTENWAAGCITYANNKFMVLPYNDAARAGDVLVSTNGWNWTTYTDVLPAAIYMWSTVCYNNVTSKWLAYNDQIKQFWRSDDEGASWSKASDSPHSSFATTVAFGGGKYVLTDNAYNVNQVYVSTDDGETWSTQGLGHSLEFITQVIWNEYDSQFVIIGGAWPGDGTIDARVSTSPDGITWTARETGSTKVRLANVQGDNLGNYVAFGAAYASANNLATTAYMYSTNSGVSWSTGTLPQTMYAGYGRPNRLIWGDIKLGL